MSGTYYNLPAISCSYRMKTWGAKSELMCANLNPDKIYKGLYPCANNPISGYNKSIDKVGQGTPLKELLDETPESCATACNSTSNCHQFNINSSPITCQLYKATKYTYNSPEAELASITNHLSAYQYNRNYKANCKDGCTQNDLQNFTEAPQYTVPTNWESKTPPLATPSTTTIKDCKQQCINNKGCNSIVYTSPKRKCQLLPKGTSPASLLQGTDNYVLADKSCQNIFGFSHDAFDTPAYQTAYNGYKPSGDDYGGKVGDYFCKYMQSTKTCVEDNEVTCNSNRRIKPKPPKPNPHSGQGPCMPPLCDPNSGKPIHKTIKGIQINDYHFQSCQPGKDKGFCIDDIYTFDDLGLPVTQNSSNPPNKNFLYTKDFSNQNGFKILSCLKGMQPYTKNTPPQPIPPNSDFSGDYICSNGKGIACTPYGYPKDPQYESCPKDNNMLNPTKKMKTVEGCLSWCSNTQTCESTNTTFDSSGNLICNFYSSYPDGVQVKSMGSNIYTKNKDPYVYTPDKGLLKKFSANRDTPYSITNTWALQCGPHGCCADGITHAKADGSNCKMTSNRVGSSEPIFQYTALGGTNTRVPINDQSGSSYINYTEVPEQFINYTPNNANNYIIKFIVILFVVLVAILIYYKYKI
jgi:hypothetical protein